jgi:hypothetical protein
LQFVGAKGHVAKASARIIKDHDELSRNLAVQAAIGEWNPVPFHHQQILLHCQWARGNRNSGMLRARFKLESGIWALRCIAFFHSFRGELF